MGNLISKIALVVTLGIAMAFTFSCSDTKDDGVTSSDGNGGIFSSSSEPSSSSSVSSSNGGISSPSDSASNVLIPPEVDTPKIMFSDDFGTEFEGNKIYITGTIYASVAYPIVRLEFVTGGPGWISYNGSPVTGITLNSPTINLSGRTIIDLENPSIPCGTHILQVKACTDANCSAGNYTTAITQFAKPESFCAYSSSGAVSSSSDAVWRFGPINTVDVPCNTSVSLASGSFMLVGDCESDAMPGIDVTGGTIRALNTMMLDDGDETPIVGKAYSGRIMGSEIPASSHFGDDEEGVSNRDYYLIYTGNARYLIRFMPKSGSSWPHWPKQGEYWLVVESP